MKIIQTIKNNKKHDKTHDKTYDKTYFNQNIINILETVKNYYSRLKNTIHVNAYERAIYQIRKWQKHITAGKELSHLEGIGKGMIEKIDTIIKTGTLPIIKEKQLKIIPILYNNNTTIKKIKKHKSNNKNTIKKTKINDNNTGNIANILGFGEKLTSKIKIKYGVETIPQLQTLVSQNKIKLTNAQEIGLKYHNDLQHKIPRTEITKIGNMIKTILIDDNVFVFIAGSYPSGLKSESKDIDILIVSRNNTLEPNKLNNIKNTELNYIISKLKTNNAISLETISLGTTKFLGIIKIGKNITENIWHHLDIRFINMQSFPYAWLYYSSGKIFNKLIREKLKKNKYKLNEWGLFKNNTKIILEDELNNNDLVNTIQNDTELMQYTTKIEKEIFKLANLEYKSVKERY